MNRKKSLLYSIGNVGACLTAATFSTYIIFYYVDVLKMPSELIGIGMAVYGIWNAINDPLLGQISDKTRSRWGRRIPYVLFGSLPFAAAFILLWTPPVKFINGSVELLFTYFMVAVFLYDGLYTLVVLNWTALFPEMYKTQSERTRVSGYRQIFGIISNIIGVALPPILFASIGWTKMGILFGVIALITLYLSLLGSREDPEHIHEGGLNFKNSLKATFTNKSFITYVIGAMFLQFTFVMLQASMPFYAKYVLKIKDSMKVSLMLGTAFISALLFIGFWRSMANKKGTKYSIIMSTILYGIGLIPYWFIKNFIGAMITAVFLGFGLAGILLLLDVCISDIVDEDELNTGVRREGMYFGVNGFMIRLGISVQSIFMGYILKLSGYDSELPVGLQPNSAILGIKILVTVIPIAALVFAILIFSKYPLHGDRLKSVKEKISNIHLDV